MNLNELSMQEKIGQRFIFGVNSHNIDVIINLIENYYIGGVILYKKNYNNYEEMLSVIKRLKKANSGNKIPLFISIDQEGGRVNRMPSEFDNLKNVYDLSKKDKMLVYKSANVTGKMLSLVGVNMNFAPVMDIYDNRSKALYKRCFYGETGDVSLVGMNYVKGLKDSGIISVPKHFPGHGVSKMDSHFITPYIYNYKDVLNRHILPFENAIKNGIDAIMVNHLVIRKLTNGLPASISANFIKTYIREKNNFNGVIITDEINMLSRNVFYRLSYMKKALMSGSDIILVRITDSGVDILNEYMKIINNNRECIKLLDESVERIIRLKDKYNVNDDISYNRCNIDEINNEIKKINERCL